MKQNKNNGFNVMARLVVLVRPLLPWMLMAIFFGVLGFLCATSLTVLGTWGLLSVVGGPAPFSLAVLLTLAAVAAVLRGFLRYGEQACNHYIAFKLLALIRDKVFGALRRLAPAKLEGKDKGDLVAIITSDVELLEVFYAHTLSPVAIAAIMSVLMIFFIGSYHPLAGALALLAYGVVGVLLPLITAHNGSANGADFRSMAGQLSGFMLDSLRGLNEVLQYEQGPARLAQLQQRTDVLCAKNAIMKRRAARATAATNVIILFFDLAMLLLLCLLHFRGSIGLSGVLVPMVALMSSFGPVVAVANLGSTLQNTLAAGARVLALLEETPLTQDITGEQEMTFQGAACRKVSFAYGETPVLRQFDMQLAKGQILGITGQSGCGKSTLLRLLMRFWDVDDGEAQISGRDIRQVNTKNLRELEGLVTQTTHLFHDSIAENLRIAKPDATLQQIEEACKKASVHEMIVALPQGYDTLVGELGDTLSGGERQRLGLARAFLHDAPFLMLDEPTSNLDSLNESVILQSITRQSKDKTVILVSHRASTTAIADQVLCMQLQVEAGGGRVPS